MSKVEKFGPRLKTLIDEKGITVRSLAKDLNVSVGLISPDREKILRDILQDIVLNTAPGERTALSEMLVQIINESVEQNADSVYQTMTDSLL